MSKINRVVDPACKSLTGGRCLLNLPIKTPAGVTTETCTGVISRQLSRSLITSLKQIAAQQNTSLPTVLLASLATVLYRYTGQADLILAFDLNLRTDAKQGMDQLAIRIDLCAANGLLRLVVEQF